MSVDKYTFYANWFDPLASSVRRFALHYYPHDNSVEMIDLRTQKIFLRRYVLEDINEEDFYVGNTLNILSRQIELVEYASSKTKEDIERKRQRTFAMIKPDATSRVGEVVNDILERGFFISQMKMMHLTRMQAMEFYKEHHYRSFFESLVDYITSGPVIAMELIGRSAVEKWREALGPTDSTVAKKENPESVRARFGVDKQENAAHGSDCIESAARELKFFFPLSECQTCPQVAASFSNNTCAIIKPHAVRDGNLGNILRKIDEGGFKISGLLMITLSRGQADEFFEVYKGVISEYSGLIQQIISGPCVALEIMSSAGETPKEFREFVGPRDPKVALELRPNSIRALYGKDKVCNAIHVSDLPEDGPLEVEYIFKILQR